MNVIESVPTEVRAKCVDRTLCAVNTDRHQGLVKCLRYVDAYTLVIFFPLEEHIVYLWGILT